MVFNKCFIYEIWNPHLAILAIIIIGIIIHTYTHTQISFLIEKKLILLAFIQTSSPKQKLTMMSPKRSITIKKIKSNLKKLTPRQLC